MTPIKTDIVMTAVKLLYLISRMTKGQARCCKYSHYNICNIKTNIKGVYQLVNKLNGYVIVYLTICFLLTYI